MHFIFLFQHTHTHIYIYMYVHILWWQLVMVGDSVLAQNINQSNHNQHVERVFFPLQRNILEYHGIYYRAPSTYRRNRTDDFSGEFLFHFIEDHQILCWVWVPLHASCHGTRLHWAFGWQSHMARTRLGTKQPNSILGELWLRIGYYGTNTFGSTPHWWQNS